MDREKVIDEINSLVFESENRILPTKKNSGALGAKDRVDFSLYSAWHTKAVSFLKMVLPEESVFIIKFSVLDENYYSNAESGIGILKNIIEYIQKEYIIIQEGTELNAEIEVKRIFSRFIRVVRQLRSRHDGRPTIEVEDEYDVQDLLHALLLLYFDDVRAEEWTPSYAGKSSRMDFLLKNEKIVIEVKKTRKTLSDKELGDQLIIDVERYKKHPDCKKLICFVYDPEGRVANPVGLIQDLNSQYDGYVEVIIEPTY